MLMSLHLYWVDAAPIAAFDNLGFYVAVTNPEILAFYYWLASF